MERLDAIPGRGYDPLEMSIHVARYLPARARVRGARVLDACCGTGYAAYMMARYWGAASVTAVDIDAASIRSAREAYIHEGLSFHDSPIEDFLDADTGEYDLIISVETLEHVADMDRVLRGFAARRAPGGALWLTLPNDPWYYGPGPSLNKYHLKTYDFEEAREAVEAVLGPATGWFLGAPAAGFATAPMEALAPGAIFDIGSMAGTEMDGVALSPDEARGLTPQTALYFGGWWGEEAPGPSAALFPAEAGWRLPPLRMTVPAGARGTFRLAMVADVPGWAFDNISKNMARVFDGRVEMDIFYLGEVTLPELYRQLYLTDTVYDHVHFLWREPALSLLGDPGAMQENMRGIAEDWARRELVDSLTERAREAAEGQEPDEAEKARIEAASRKVSPERAAEILKLIGPVFAERLGAAALTCAIYDHLHLEPGSVAARRNGFGFIDGYSVASRRLGRIYHKTYGLQATAETPDGVDLSLFRPANLERFDDTDRPLVVGWVGNSEWARSHDRDPKGLHSILKPALEMLRAEGLAIEGVFADRKERWRPREEMPDYYAGIDVLVCASEIEGTPNPVLECMACGVPAVSTDVGIVPEVFGPEQRAFIVERSPAAMASALKTLAEDRARLKKLSAENLSRIAGWEWRDHAGAWTRLFTEARRTRLAGTGRAREALARMTAVREADAMTRRLGSLLTPAPAKATKTRRKKNRRSWGYVKEKAIKLFRTGRL